MKGIRRRLTGAVAICLFLSCLFFTNCHPPEYYAIPPVNQDSILNALRKPDTALVPEKKGPQAVTIEIQSMKFKPEEIYVHKGDTVIWDNQDLVAHCVTEDPGKAWTSLEIEPGNTWKKVVDKSTNYYCAIHLVMKGRIVVE
jgi:plastocyanin